MEGSCRQAFSSALLQAMEPTSIFMSSPRTPGVRRHSRRSSRAFLPSPWKWALQNRTQLVLQPDWRRQERESLSAGQRVSIPREASSRLKLMSPTPGPDVKIIGISGGVSYVLWAVRTTPFMT